MSVRKIGRLSSVGRVSTVVVLVSMLLGACDAAVLPADSPTIRPTLGATPDPAPIEPRPIAPAVADPAASLTIGQPYLVHRIDALYEKSLLTTMRTALSEELESEGNGATAHLVQIGFREVALENDSLAGVYVFAIPGTVGDDSTIDGTLDDIESALTGIADPGGDLFVDTTVAGMVVPVRRDMAVGGSAIFQAGDRLLLVSTRSDTTVVPIVTSVIDANR